MSRFVISSNLIIHDVYIYIYLNMSFFDGSKECGSLQLVN